MPLFKEFGENGELTGTRSEPLGESNLEQYIKEHGLEKALGYLDALNDITTELKSFLEIHSTKSWRYNTDHKITRGTIKFYEQKGELLDFVKKVLKHDDKIEP